jgi:hypothetical protein
LVAGVACLALFCGSSLHPKGGDEDVRALAYFSIASAVGIGMSLGGIRFSTGYTKAVAYAAFALFATVALNLANVLWHV